MNVRIIVVSVVAVLVLLLGYSVATPYITVAQMQSAVEARDGAELATHVDFVAVRQSLYTQLTALLSEQMDQTSQDDVMGLFGAAFGNKMIELLLDVIVTPQGLIAVISGDSMVDVLDQDTTGAAPNTADISVSMGYRSFDTFGVTITNQDTFNETTLILRRQGLTWRVSEILLPKVLN